MSDVAVRDGGGEVVQRTPAQELVARVRSDEFKEQAAMVLPDNVPASRFVRGTVTALLANPDLAKIEDWDSIFIALLRSAQDGLLPDGREAAIVAYGKKASYLPMIGGIRKVAGEFGWTIDTKVVRANDEFSYEYGLDAKVSHRPAAGDRGTLIYAYAVGRHRDGRRELEVMDASEIAKVRKSSRASGKGPWVDWEERMWEKSVGHRIFKRLPLDPSDQRVASIIDAGALPDGEAARMLYGPSGAPLGQVREITQDSSDKGAVSQAEEEGPRSPTPPAGGSDDQAPALAAPSPEPTPVNGQQAAGAAPDEAVSSAVPGPPPAFPVPDQVVDTAGAVVVQDGWTVAAVCDDPTGKEWARAVLAGTVEDVDAKVKDALRLYAGQRHTDLIEATS